MENKEEKKKENITQSDLEEAETKSQIFSNDSTHISKAINSDFTIGPEFNISANEQNLMQTGEQI